MHGCTLVQVDESCRARTSLVPTDAMRWLNQRIVVDEETGAVLFTEETANEDFNKIRLACPFNIPRQDPDTGRLFKCVMCVDRVHNGELPACAKACPSDAIEFGDREEMLAQGEARVAALQGEFPEARIVDRRDVRLLILLADPAEAYTMQAGA